MVSIEVVGTAVPEYQYSTEELLLTALEWLKESDWKQELIRRFFSSSLASSRAFALPAPDLLHLRGMSERAKLYDELVPALASRAGARALAQWQGEIGVSLFTSCSCPVIPAPDGILLDNLGLSRTILRLPIYQSGCAGGVVGLSAATRFASGGSTVLLTAAELCSLVFQPQDTSPTQLVGASLFGDGAASVVVSPGENGPLIIEATSSYLIPESRHIMGYDLLDDGHHLRLDKGLPALLENSVNDIVSAFLEDNDVGMEEIRWWLFHPGGAKILNGLVELFHLEREQCRFAYDVLRKHGNMSSATILFVIQEFLEQRAERRGDRALVMGIGPGLSVELILLRCQ